MNRLSLSPQQAGTVDIGTEAVAQRVMEEYSFFLYDFARNTWNDATKTMTGKPYRMRLEHRFDNVKTQFLSFGRTAA